MRYARLLLVPLRPAGAITLVVLSMVLTASSLAGPYGLPLIVILMSWFFKYSFALLEGLSSGHTEAPVLSVEMIVASLGEFRWMVPLLLVIVAFFISGTASFLPGAARTLLALELLACLPAVLILQSWTGRLRHSLNPRVWVIVSRNLGNDYVWVVGWMLALAVLCIALPSTINRLPRMLRIALCLYAWLALMALVGRAFFVHREQLSQTLPLIARDSKPWSLDDLLEERERWLDSIYGSWRGGAKENAYRSVMQRLEATLDPTEELKWLWIRLSKWEPRHFTDRLAQELVSRLLAEDREGEALRLIKECLSHSCGFVPRDEDEKRRLAQLATQWGDRDLAMALLRQSA